MIGIVSYNRSQREQVIIEEGCRTQVGKRTEEKMNFKPVGKREELQALLSSDHLLHFLYYEVNNDHDIEMLKRLRRADSSALLMLLTSPAVSPMKYLKPGLSPDSLLLRPFGQKEFDAVNQELFDAYMESMDSRQGDAFFPIRTREENTRVPFSKILYFEASNKKITVRAGNEEYEIYGSIEGLAETVPDCFVRTHRSYLVNLKKIRCVKLTEGIIELEHGASVPISRTYRHGLKELLR